MVYEVSDEVDVENLIHNVEDDFYYNLFDGGYIHPEDVLKHPEDIDEVIEAVNVIRKFLETCESLAE